MLGNWIVSRLTNVQVRFGAKDLQSPFGTDVTAEGSDGFVAYH